MNDRLSCGFIPNQNTATTLDPTPVLGPLLLSCNTINPRSPNCHTFAPAQRAPFSRPLQPWQQLASHPVTIITAVSIALPAHAGQKRTAEAGWRLASEVGWWGGGEEGGGGGGFEEAMKSRISVGAVVCVGRQP